MFIKEKKSVVFKNLSNFPHIKKVTQIKMYCFNFKNILWQIQLVMAQYIIKSAYTGQ